MLDHITEMRERILASFRLLCDCVRILVKDPELVLFPLMSSLAMIAVAASFLLPLRDSAWSIQTIISQSEDSLRQHLTEPITWLLVFLYYFANYFVITFFNSALVACVVVRAEGGVPMVATGLRFAVSRLPQILGWSVVAGTVGTLLKFLESRSESSGRWVSSLGGFAWSLATFFVVPVMVVEKVGPLAAIRRSMAVMKDTWGELLVAGITLGPVKSIGVILCFLPFFACCLINTHAAVLFGGIVSLLTLLLALLVFATLDAIFLSALYLYATDRKVAAEFTRCQLADAFLPRAQE